MSGQLFVSIDIGTSSCKTVLMDETGRRIGSASREYPTFFGGDDAAWQNADDWWGSVCAAVREITEPLPGRDLRRIAAVGIDGQSSVMLPVDRQGEPLCPAMIWTDHRAKAETRWIEENLGQSTLSEINGNKNNASNVAPKIMWLRDHHPELYAKTYKILSAVGYLVCRLTGVFSLNVSEGGLTQLFDIRRGTWSDLLISGCKLDKGLLPDVYQCYEIVGPVRREAAECLGLPPGIPVTAGAMDVCACALGTGTAAAGDALITGGTVTAVCVCTDQPLQNSSLHVYHHIVPGLWCAAAGVDFGGGSFRWFRDQFMSDCGAGYEEMNRLAAASVPGANRLLFFPAMVGQRSPQWDSAMRGAWIGITPGHGKREFLRAVMEGTAYGVREIVELQERGGAGLTRIMIAGGISRSELWLQILADVLRRRIYRVLSQEDTALGNLISAAYGIRLFDTLEVGLDGRQLVPVACSEEIPSAYDRMYRIYRQIYPALKTTFDELAK